MGASGESVCAASRKHPLYGFHGRRYGIMESEWIDESAQGPWKPLGMIEAIGLLSVVESRTWRTCLTPPTRPQVRAHKACKCLAESGDGKDEETFHDEGNG